jgi:hypothetical protein
MTVVLMCAAVTIMAYGFIEEKVERANAYAVADLRWNIPPKYRSVTLCGPVTFAPQKISIDGYSGTITLRPEKEEPVTMKCGEFAAMIRLYRENKNTAIAPLTISPTDTKSSTVYIEEPWKAVPEYEYGVRKP